MFQRKAPIVGRKVRAALVGCGRISERHFDALANHTKDLELVAVCDSDLSRLDVHADKLKVEGFTSYSSLLQKSEADLVILCTPSGLHPEQAIQASESGKHVMTEKPMATRWGDGKQMVAAADQAGTHLFVVKQNRTNPTLMLLKSAIDQGRFGRIFMVNVNVFWSRPQSYYSSAKWRGTWEFDGGALMNQASHYIDLMDWLVGPVESVQAFTATLARNIEVEDTAVVNVRWRSGALGSANVTMLAYNKNFEGSITILGEKGTVRLGGVALNKIDHWEFETTHAEDAKVKDASYGTDSVYGFGHRAYYANVIQALRGEATPQTDGREGLRSLELLIASYKSARDGQRISLPLEY